MNLHGSQIKVLQEQYDSLVEQKQKMELAAEEMKLVLAELRRRITMEQRMIEVR